MKSLYKHMNFTFPAGSVKWHHCCYCYGPKVSENRKSMLSGVFQTLKKRKCTTIQNAKI